MFSVPLLVSLHGLPVLRHGSHHATHGEDDQTLEEDGEGGQSHLRHDEIVDVGEEGRVAALGDLAFDPVPGMHHVLIRQLIRRVEQVKGRSDGAKFQTHVQRCESNALQKAK